jgi:hypothetical protein
VTRWKRFHPKNTAEQRKHRESVKTGSKTATRKEIPKKSFPMFSLVNTHIWREIGDYLEVYLFPFGKCTDIILASLATTPARQLT